MSYESHESHEYYKSHTKRETELRKNADCKIHFRTGHAGIPGLGMVDDDSQRLPRDRSGDLEIARPCRFHRTVAGAGPPRLRTESRADGMVRKDARHRRALAQRRARNFETAERIISRRISAASGSERDCPNDLPRRARSLPLAVLIHCPNSMRQRDRLESAGFLEK